MLYVIVSTFNGEKYLTEQIESLLAQDCSPIKIMIRDDGSTDGTREILKSYSEQYENIDVTYGENVGVIQSFFELLTVIPDDANFMAFCDQDDIWMKNKLSRAVNFLSRSPNSQAALYFCRLNMVDEKLNSLFFSPLPNKEITFKNALVENIATGCTMVLNQQALILVKKKFPDFKKIQMHDAWVYQIMTALGKVIYDPEPQILYRQHSGNTIGAKKGISLFWSRLKRFLKNKHRPKFSDQALEFKKIYYSQLTPENKIILDRFIGASQGSTFFERIRFIMNSTVYRQKKLDNFIFKILFIFAFV